MTPTLILLTAFILCATEGAQPTDPFFMLQEFRSQDGKKPNTGRRTSLSDQLPVDDLIESSDKAYDPRPSDINEKLLIKQLQLGSNFRAEFVSVRDPGVKSPSLVERLRERPIGKRPKFLDPFRSSMLKVLGKRELRKVETYLWKFTSCPVVHSWKYVGKRFWPHWIKEGKCLRKRSCSLPEGMTCNPSSSEDVALLRWHCSDYKDRGTCQWIRILYPVITECSCGCRSES